MNKYTKQQLSIITHEKGHSLIKACPGSGKTRTMIGRVQYLIAKRNVPIHNILVLTFGKETSLTFSDKLKEKNIPSDKRRLENSVRVCTFHSFALRELNISVRNGTIPSFNNDPTYRSRLQWKHFKAQMDLYMEGGFNP